MSNNSFTKEFKIKAVELLEQGNKSVRQVAKELGVAENNLYNWRKQFHKKQEKAFPNQPQFDEKELELRRLRTRVAELEDLLLPIIMKEQDSILLQDQLIFSIPSTKL